MTEISALCFIKVEKYRFDVLVEKLKEIPFLIKYHVITGDYDGVLEINVDDVKDLYIFFKEMESISGITKMNTHQTRNFVVENLN